MLPRDISHRPSVGMVKQSSWGVMMRALRKWWYIPLVAILGILIKAFVVAGMLTGMVQDASVTALADAGLDGSVTYAGYDGVSGLGRDGLNVALEGPASAEAAAVAAVGSQESVNKVSYRVIEVDAPEAVKPEAEADVPQDQAPAEDSAPTAALKPVAVTLAAGGAIVLSGVVPDEATSEALVASANEEYGASNVADNLTIEPEGLSIQDGTLVVSGKAASDEEKAGWLAQAAPVAASGGLTLVDEVKVVAEAAPIEDSLNSLFELAPIEFDTKKALIRDSSMATLDEAAEMINANPAVGRLLVVGHTDSDGGSESNLRLSHARASAVVQYLVEVGGVDPARLESVGRGETELLVSPEESSADKQRNRRIAWEIKS